MDALEFDSWWREFLLGPRVRGANDSGYAAVEELTRYVAGLSPGLRAAFVNEVAGVACARSEGWGLALGLLEKAHDPQALERIAAHVRDVSATRDDDGDLSAFLRVLGVSVESHHRALLAQYLLVAPIAPGWTSVPWALWPHDRDLFGKAWARYFSSIPSARWRNTAVIQAFLSRPDALVCVRDALRASDPTAWGVVRDAIMGRLDSPWLNADDRDQVRLACGPASHSSIE